MSETGRVELGWAAVDLLAGLIRLGIQRVLKIALAPTDAPQQVILGYGYQNNT